MNIAVAGVKGDIKGDIIDIDIAVAGFQVQPALRRHFNIQADIDML